MRLVNALVFTVLNVWIQHLYGGCLVLVLLDVSNGVLINVSMQVYPHIHSVRGHFSGFGVCHKFECNFFFFWPRLFFVGLSPPGRIT